MRVYFSALNDFRRSSAINQVFFQISLVIKIHNTTLMFDQTAANLIIVLYKIMQINGLRIMLSSLVFTRREYFDRMNLYIKKTQNKSVYSL